MSIYPAALAQMVDHLIAHAARADEDDLGALVRANDCVLVLFASAIPLAHIPIPTPDADPIRVGLAAGLLERLAEVFATPPHCSQQQAPTWCAEVLPLREPLWLIREDLARYGLSPTLERRNIMALANVFMFA